jgi:hypothetical protein
MRRRAALGLALIALAAAPAAAQPGPPAAPPAPAGSGSAAARPDLDPLVFGEPEVSAVASPTEVRLGQPFTLVVTAVYGDGVTVNLPDPLVLGDAFGAGHREVTDRKRSDGRHVREWQIKVRAWELGDIYLPPVQVTFTAGGRAAAVATNALPIRVIGVLGDADDPKLMRGMTAPVPLLRRDWLLAFVAGGVVLVIGGILIWLVARRRRRRVPERIPLAVDLPRPAATAAPAPTPRPRRRVDGRASAALARLAEIEASGRLDDERVGAHVDMVEVIRDYLGGRFDLDAAELTTAELCRHLAGRVAAADHAAVAAWFGHADEVRYGHVAGSGEAARATLDGARELIYATTPGGRHRPSAELEAARA